MVQRRCGLQQCIGSSVFGPCSQRGEGCSAHSWAERRRVTSPYRALALYSWTSAAAAEAAAIAAVADATAASQLASSAALQVTIVGRLVAPTHRPSLDPCQPCWPSIHSIYTCMRHSAVAYIACTHHNLQPVTCAQQCPRQAAAAGAPPKHELQHSMMTVRAVQSSLA